MQKNNMDKKRANANRERLTENFVKAKIIWELNSYLPCHYTSIYGDGVMAMIMIKINSKLNWDENHDWFQKKKKLGRFDLPSKGVSI